MSDAGMGSGSEQVQASSDVSAEEGQGSMFECPYCGEVYGCVKSRSVCQASHFRGTGSVTHRPRSEDKKKNIVDEWKKS